METSSRGEDLHSPWRRRDGWRLAGESECTLHWLDQKLERHLTLAFHRSALRITSDDESAATIAHTLLDGADLAFELDSVPVRARVRRQRDEFEVALNGETWRLGYLDPLTRQADAKADPARLAAPVHGRVLEVQVAPGSKVKRGQALMLLECMKLEYRITAPADGVVEAIHFAAGDVVEEGAQLLAFAPAS
jgi:3-methylcrotonyl-CoA carboxylase alpha subunit